MTRPESQSTPQTLFEKLLRDEKYGTLLQEIASRYRDLILGYCRARGLRDDQPDEVAQVVLLRLAEKLHGFQYDRTKSFRGWLYTVTRNEANRFHEWQKRAAEFGMIGTGGNKTNDLLNEQSDGAKEADVIAAEADEFKLYEQACEAVRNNVNAATWIAFAQTTLENRPARIVSSELGITVKAVYGAKARVLEMLRAQVERLQPKCAIQP
jgi:RNA polymerase sigma-70 factor (ECF subfamily)